MRLRYIAKKFSPDHQGVIEQANQICEEYTTAGLQLTLRQLYYQFVARALLPNQQAQYKRLGSILNDARMAGEMDWDYLVDRTRNLVEQRHWDTPADLIQWAAKQYRIDMWAPQKKRIEVWIEKDAGIGVIESVCQSNGVPYFSCRGYTSVSELHDAADRIRWYIERGDQVTILHVGDHDPSGLDMTRDMEDRLRTFVHVDWVRTWGRHLSRPSRGEIRADMRRHMRERGSSLSDQAPPWRMRRIALNYDQVQRYQPPPNPAKTTDSRFIKYQQETGLDESWELDALDPYVLQDLIQEEINNARDDEVWGNTQERMDRGLIALQHVSENWATITQDIQGANTNAGEEAEPDGED